MTAVCDEPICNDTEFNVMTDNDSNDDEVTLTVVARSSVTSRKVRN